MNYKTSPIVIDTMMNAAKAGQYLAECEALLRAGTDYDVTNFVARCKATSQAKLHAGIDAIRIAKGWAPIARG